MAADKIVIIITVFSASSTVASEQKLLFLLPALLEPSFLYLPPRSTGKNNDNKTFREREKEREREREKEKEIEIEREIESKRERESKREQGKDTMGER